MPRCKRDPLCAQIVWRHTNRSGYDMSRAVPPDAWAAMAAAVSSPVRVDFAGVEQGALALAAHRRIASEAWRIALTVPRTTMESLDVLRVGQSEIAAHRDGLSLTVPTLPLQMTTLPPARSRTSMPSWLPRQDFSGW